MENEGPKDTLNPEFKEDVKEDIKVSEENPMLQKALKEKKNAMEALRRLEEENKQLKEAKLKEKEDYKNLYETKDKELEELKQKYTEKEEVIRKGVKLSSIKKELTKIGINPDYMDKAIKFVDLDSVEYDSDSGICTGADRQAKSVFESLPVFFGQAKVGVNQSAPVGGSEPLTLETWKKLPAKEQKERYQELKKNLGV